MKAQIFSLCIFACRACAFDIDDALDRFDSTLTISGFQDNFRARLSGTVDLEFYNFQQPAPGLIDSEIDNLFNPRLTLFVDAQAGSQVYFFAQARLDRGFDPSDHGADVRLDEYALRITPWQDGRFTLQVGQFATVVGNWVPRHLPWKAGDPQDESGTKASCGHNGKFHRRRTPPPHIGSGRTTRSRRGRGVP